MKIKYLLFLVLSLKTNGFASLTNSVFLNNFVLKAGINTSFFVSEKSSESGYGYSLSYNKEFNFFKNSLISLGIGYAEKEAVLKNVTVQPYTTSEQIDAHYWDIKGRIGYLEVPIMIRYEFIMEKVSISPIFGLFLSYPKRDLSKFEKKTFYRIDDPGGDDSKFYDYDFEQETAFRSHGHEKVLCIGIRIQKNRFGLEMVYLINNRNEYDFKSLSTIYSKMHSILTQLTINF